MDERIEDTFLEIIKKFPSTWEFKKFALLSCGLSLSFYDVNTITGSGNIRLSDEEKKVEILKHWKETTRDNATPQRLREIHFLYFQPRQQLVQPQPERLEDVFYEVTKKIPPRDFIKFARTKNGLYLPGDIVLYIAENHKGDAEERSFQFLLAWRARLPDTLDAGIIRSIRQIVERYPQLDQDHVAQNARVVVEEAVPRLEAEPPEKKRKLANSGEFLDIVNSFTKGQVESVTKTIREETNLDEILLPAVNRVKLTEDTENESVIGTDLEETDISKIHNYKSVNHVMLLGNTGCGKTTFAHFYAKSALEDELDLLKGIKMVYFVNVSRLQADSKSTVFELMFVQQLGAKLPSDLHEVGKEWLAENSSCVLLIIDGLDQAQKAFESELPYPKIARDSNAKTNVIIANLLSGHIYPEMKILSTTRWSVYGELHPDQRPGVTFALRGFDKISLDRLKNTMISRDKVTFIDALQEKSSIGLSKIE